MGVSRKGQAPLVWPHAGGGGYSGHLAEPGWVTIFSDLHGVTQRCLEVRALTILVFLVRMTQVFLDWASEVTLAVTAQGGRPQLGLARSELLL